MFAGYAYSWAIAPASWGIARLRYFLEGLDVFDPQQFGCQGRLASGIPFQHYQGRSQPTSRLDQGFSSQRDHYGWDRAQPYVEDSSEDAA